jgi:hypothetical protein
MALRKQMLVVPVAMQRIFEPRPPTELEAIRAWVRANGGRWTGYPRPKRARKRKSSPKLPVRHEGLKPSINDSVLRPIRPLSPISLTLSPKCPRGSAQDRL